MVSLCWWLDHAAESPQWRGASPMPSRLLPRIPWGESGSGNLAWGICPFSHTCIFFTTAGSRVQTVHGPAVQYIYIPGRTGETGLETVCGWVFDFQFKYAHLRSLEDNILQKIIHRTWKIEHRCLVRDFALQSNTRYIFPYMTLRSPADQ
jgi:hypothetical protein